MESNESGGDRGNVVDFAAKQALAKVSQEPFLSDAERKEIREMLAYYRKARPEFEAMKKGCPTARWLLNIE